MPPERWAGAPQRYPDPAVVTLDERFGACVIGNAAVERIATGMRWAEGPVWFGDHRCLRLERHPEQPHAALGRGDRRRHGLPQAVALRQRQHARPPGPARHLRARHAAASRAPSTTAASPSLPTASTASRSTPPTTWSSQSDGSIWFTDPGYGILVDYEGEQGRARAADARLPHRPPSGHARVVARRPRAAQRPLLLARRVAALRRRLRLEPEARSTSSTSSADGTLSERPHLRRHDPGGSPTASAATSDGNLWAAAWAARGLRRRPRLRPRRHAHRPDRPAREVLERLLRRPHRNRLFMTASQSAYALYVNVRGI